MDGELDRARETMAGRAREMTDRAPEAAPEAAARAQEVAQDLARRADERLARMTGRSAADWAERTRALVREHPLPAIAVALGLGYVAGKLLRR